MAAQIVFLLVLIAAIGLFTINVRKIIRNINLGLPLDRSDRPGKRWLTMLRVAFGQTKMFIKPLPAVMHFLIYAGFLIINIEILEIIIDGIFGTHRVFAAPLGGFYNFIIGTFEWLALGVLIACVVFLVRRNILKVGRFFGTEMTKWPRSDANWILIIEIVLMGAFLKMNAADYKLQLMNSPGYISAGYFPISSWIPLFPDNENTLIVLERTYWWFHILGVLAFLNYLPYSKHFHIIMAFPNTWYSNLEPKGEFTNMPSVTNEVRAMLDPSFTPAGPVSPTSRFGAKDVTDLTWKSLMDAYTCTECGRCTAECPANITGKLLSPRKIVMDTRDRLAEVGRNIDKHCKDHDDGKSLLDTYITREELWACTTCNACTQACPVNIDPLAIIMDMRRYIVMEESKAPASLNNMFGNTENNGAPWKYAQGDRMNWREG